MTTAHKVAHLKVFIDNISMCVKSSILAKLEELVRPGLIHSFRESHPQKLRGKALQARVSKQSFTMENHGDTGQSDGQGRIRASSTGQGISLAGVPLGPYRTMMRDNMQQQSGKLDLLVETQSRKSLWCC